MSGQPCLKIFLIVALLRYQATLPRDSIPMEPRRSDGTLMHSQFYTHLKGSRLDSEQTPRYPPQVTSRSQ